MTVRLAPSLLSADFTRLAEEIAEVEQAGADLLHLDIMDGHFVPNLTFGPPIVKALASRCQLGLDAHLMVSDPDPLIPQLADAGVHRVSVHVEAPLHLHRSLQLIRDAGMQVGLALNPATPLAAIEEALAWVDFLVIMTVNPGFGGQRLIPECLDKIRRLGSLLEDRRRASAPVNTELYATADATADITADATADITADIAVDITVDGGVDESNAGSLVRAGATTLVAGTAIFGADNRAAAITDLRRAAAGGEQQ